VIYLVGELIAHKKLCNAAWNDLRPKSQQEWCSFTMLDDLEGEISLAVFSE